MPVTVTQKEIEKILQPFSPDDPSGMPIEGSLLFDHQFHAIKTAFDENNWDDVIDFSLEILIEDYVSQKTELEKQKAEGNENYVLKSIGKSKDLTVSAYLTLALVHKESFNGLRKGLYIIRNLLTIFWDTIYPHRQNNDFAYWINPLMFIFRLEKAPYILKKTSVISSSSDYNFEQWEDIDRLQKKLENRKNKKEVIDETKHKEIIAKLIKDIDEKTNKKSLAIDEADVYFLQEQLGNIEKCEKELRKFTSFITNQFIASYKITDGTIKYLNAHAESKKFNKSLIDCIEALKTKDFQSKKELIQAVKNKEKIEILSEEEKLLFQYVKKDSVSFDIQDLKLSIEGCLRIAKVIFEQAKKNSKIENNVDNKESSNIGYKISVKEEILDAIDNSDSFMDTDETEEYLMNDLIKNENSDTIEVNFSQSETSHDNRPNFMTSCSMNEKKMYNNGLSILMGNKTDINNLLKAIQPIKIAVNFSPSKRQECRYKLLIAKLCLKADKPEFAIVIAEELYKMIEEMDLIKWESPVWISEIIDTYYQCLLKQNNDNEELKNKLFNQLCSLNITKILIGKNNNIIEK